MSRIPNLIVLGGAVAVGKSTIARRLAQALKHHDRTVRLLQSDVIRKQLIGAPLREQAPSYCQSDAFRSFIYRTIHEAARLVLTLDGRAREVVILDASYTGRSSRDELQNVCDPGAEGMVIRRFWLDAPLEVRVERAQLRTDDASDATAHFARMQQIDPPSTNENWIFVDNASAPHLCLERIWDHFPTVSE